MLNGTGGYGVATGGPTAWGLCYNKELSPSQSYCDDYYKLTYPCAPGVDYYGRGAIPIYWLAIPVFLALFLFFLLKIISFFHGRELRFPVQFSSY